MTENSLIIHNMDDAVRASTAMAKSGYFKDAENAAQAVVKILAGHEMGFGAFASMTGVHIISGKPAIGSNLIAAAIKRHPMYNYKVTHHDEKRCQIDFYENWNGKWEKVGESIFTIEDAQAAGLMSNPTWKKYARNMLFSRAISNGARWYCPDVFGGAPTYTPEELGAEVDEDENVIEAEIIEQPAVTISDEKPVTPSIQNEPFDKPNLPAWILQVENRDGQPYYTLETEVLSHMANSIQKALSQEVADVQRQEYERKAEAIRHIMAERNK